MRAAAAVLAALALAVAVTAQGPPLNGDFQISLSPILTPWANGASANAGSSNSVGNSVARVTFGACTYLVAHSHANAWELLTPITPGLSLTSYLENPTSEGGQLRTFTVGPDQSITFPQGWLHVSLNNNCQPLDAILVWNAVGTGGTVAFPPSLATLPVSYTNAAYTAPLPAPGNLWAVDAACAAQCGIPTNTTMTKEAAIKAKLQTAVGLLPGAEQVAAAKAAAMFGSNVKTTLEKGLTSVVNSTPMNKTKMG